MNLADLLLHPTTRQAVDDSLRGGAHALVLAGPAGSGKQTVGRAIAASALQLPIERLDVAPYYRQVEPAATGIGIDQVRELQQFLRLRTTGTAPLRRVLLLLQADTMNAQAQNALLKTLEEPPVDTMLILTVNDVESLLATVRSRVRVVQVLPAAQPAALAYFAASGGDTSKAYSISGGHAGLMHSLLHGDTAQAATANIDMAKQLLAAPVYERLTQVEAIAKDKAAIGPLLAAFKRICRGALAQAASRNQVTHVAAWHKRLSVVDHAESLYGKGANGKLLLTDLFLNL